MCILIDHCVHVLTKRASGINIHTTTIILSTPPTSYSSVSSPMTRSWLSTSSAFCSSHLGGGWSRLVGSRFVGGCLELVKVGDCWKARVFPKIEDMF